MGKGKNRRVAVTWARNARCKLQLRRTQVDRDRLAELEKIAATRFIVQDQNHNLLTFCRLEELVLQAHYAGAELLSLIHFSGSIIIDPGTQCPYCKARYYGGGDPIKKHVEYCDKWPVGE